MNVGSTAHRSPAGDLEVGHFEMDRSHAALAMLIDAAFIATDADIGRRLEALSARMSEHFAEEDALMANAAYPSSRCHLDDHAAVLASLVEVRPLVDRGNVALGRRLAVELSRWFPQHIDALDRSLAVWLCRLRTGGAPVVVDLHSIRRPDR